MKTIVNFLNFLADILLTISLWLRPKKDCPAGTGWAALNQDKDSNSKS